MGGEVISDTVWRKILADHPGLINVCLPGNEATLETVRREHPKLDDAIKKFGLPKPKLLKELTGSLLKQSFSFEEKYRMNENQIQHFVSEGYVVVRNAVPLSLVKEARRFINASIGRGAVDRSIPGLIGVDKSSVSAPQLMSLFSGPGSRLPTLAQSLMGKGKMRPP